MLVEDIVRSINKFVRTTMRLFNEFFFSIVFHSVDVMFPFDCTINFPLILLDFVIEFANFTWLRTD